MPRSLSPSDIADFRGRLCEVAARLLAELGRDGFNMRELASRMGVSAMTTYRYFKDKNDILGAMRDRAFARLADRFETAVASFTACDEKIAALGAAYADFARHETEHYTLMFDLALPKSRTSSPVPEDELRARALLAEPLHQMAAEGQLAGDPDTTAKILWAALHGIAVLHLTGRIADGEFERFVAEALCAVLPARRSAFSFAAGTHAVLAGNANCTAPGAIAAAE